MILTLTAALLCTFVQHSTQQTPYAAGQASIIKCRRPVHCTHPTQLTLLPGPHRRTDRQTPRQYPRCTDQPTPIHYPTSHTCINDSRGTLCSRRPASAVPTIDAVMNMAKMKPWGSFSPAGLSAGVHKNTNVYMEASNSAWLAPSNATRASEVVGEETSASHTETAQHGTAQHGRRVRFGY